MSCAMMRSSSRTKIRPCSFSQSLSGCSDRDRTTVTSAPVRSAVAKVPLLDVGLVGHLPAASLDGEPEYVACAPVSGEGRLCRFVHLAAVGNPQAFRLQQMHDPWPFHRQQHPVGPAGEGLRQYELSYDLSMLIESSSNFSPTESHQSHQCLRLWAVAGDQIRPLSDALMLTCSPSRYPPPEMLV